MNRSVNSVRLLKIVETSRKLAEKAERLRRKSKLLQEHSDRLHQNSQSMRRDLHWPTFPSPWHVDTPCL